MRREVYQEALPESVSIFIEGFIYAASKELQ